MGDQRAVALLLYAAGLTDKAAVMDCKAQCLRRSLRHFFVIAMVLFAAPAIELNVAEHALTGCVAGNQRASVAGPEIFGWDIPECVTPALKRGWIVLCSAASAQRITGSKRAMLLAISVMQRCSKLRKARLG